MVQYAQANVHHNLAQRLKFDVYDEKGRIPVIAESFDIFYSKGVEQAFGKEIFSTLWNQHQDMVDDIKHQCKIATRILFFNQNIAISSIRLKSLKSTHVY